MPWTPSDLRRTLLNIFQIGKGGVQLVNNSGALQVKGADGTTDAPLSAGNLVTTGSRISTPAIAQSLTAASTISVVSEVIQLTSSGAVTLTSSPAIASGTSGQRIVLFNSGSFPITIPASGVSFLGGNTSFTLVSGAIAVFVYLGGTWQPLVEGSANLSQLAQLAGVASFGLDFLAQVDAVAARKKLGLGVVGSSIYNSANVSISSSVSGGTVIPCDSEEYSYTGMHSKVSNTSRVVITVAGFYLISGNIAFEYNSMGGFRGLKLLLNGSTIIANQIVSAAASMGQSPITGLCASRARYLNAGDYIELQAIQSSGVSINVLAATNYSPGLQVFLLGG